MSLFLFVIFLMTEIRVYNTVHKYILAYPVPGPGTCVEPFGSGRTVRQFSLLLGKNV